MSALLVVAGYLLGSIPTGLLLARRAGIDPRRAGSGNIGATNVLRTAGRRLGFLTLAGDLAKGALPTWLALRLGAGETVTGLTGLAAVLGHLFPPWLRFHGGKGVATALGAILVLAPGSATLGVLAFGLVVGASGYVSLASLVACTVVAGVMSAGRAFAWPMGVLMAALIVARHAGNLRRLVAGTEPRTVRPFLRQRP
jgi:glycerol-3-phosphate acyltransferase PlsY